MFAEAGSPSDCFCFVAHGRRKGSLFSVASHTASAEIIVDFPLCRRRSFPWGSAIVTLVTRGGVVMCGERVFRVVFSCIAAARFAVLFLTVVATSSVRWSAVVAVVCRQILQHHYETMAAALLGFA